MTSPRRPLVAGNWKMNGSRAALGEIAALASAYDAALRARADLLICPPVTLLALAGPLATPAGIALGAQDCHAAVSGAHTGDIAAEMLADLGATYVIVGHSERRADHGESDAQVQAKARAAMRAGLAPIVCVGETRLERDAGGALDVVAGQIAGSVPSDIASDQLVLAYEPVWAIGTGVTPTLQDVAEMHGFARGQLETLLGGGRSAAVRILYGGSVKPANARELMHVADVDGALVGGASLTAKDFLGVADAYR
jgi:triosephosphate isomerase (TIM)